MSVSMVFSKGVRVAHGIWACFLLELLFLVSQVPQAVGRKDLRNAAPGMPPAGGSDPGSAANANHLSVARSPPALRVNRHTRAHGEHPSAGHSISRCDHQ